MATKVVPQPYPCARLREKAGDPDAIALVDLTYVVVVSDHPSVPRLGKPGFDCADKDRCGISLELGQPYRWSLCPHEHSPPNDP